MTTNANTTAVPTLGTSPFVSAHAPAAAGPVRLPVEGVAVLPGPSLHALAGQAQTLFHAGGGITTVHLSPPSLGGVAVHLTVLTDGSASLSFLAAQASTTQAIQASLPALHAALQQAQVPMAQVTVTTADAGSGANASTAQTFTGGQGGGGHASHPQAALASHGREASPADTSMPHDPGVMAYA